MTTEYKDISEVIIEQQTLLNELKMLARRANPPPEDLEKMRVLLLQIANVSLNGYRAVLVA